MSTNNPNHQQKSLYECTDLNSINNLNSDQSPPYCNSSEGPDQPNKRGINGDGLEFLRESSMQKIGFGAKVDCDPMQRGQIVEDASNTDRNVLYRYSKAIRGTDEAVLDLFKNVVVIDEDGKAWPIPIILGPPEKAVAAILQNNVRKDETLVVDRIRLPMMALSQGDIEYDVKRYAYHKAIDYYRGPDGKPGITIQEKYPRDTILGFAKGIPINIGYKVTAWTTYREDMNQILEQILTKFSQQAYIRVTGVPWEVTVSLNSMSNNLNVEPGDQAIRVIKYEFNLTVQTYIPQPIERKKAILNTRVDIVDGLSEDQINSVLTKIEEAAKENEC
jgi:hypothetical protein